MPPEEGQEGKPSAAVETMVRRNERNHEDISDLGMISINSI
jgi:hypothetical protein